MRGSSFVLRFLLSCFLSRLNISIFICMQIYYNNEFNHFFFEDLLHSLLVCVCVCVCVTSIWSFSFSRRRHWPARYSICSPRVRELFILKGVPNRRHAAIHARVCLWGVFLFCKWAFLGVLGPISVWGVPFSHKISTVLRRTWPQKGIPKSRLR